MFQYDDQRPRNDLILTPFPHYIRLQSGLKFQRFLQLLRSPRKLGLIFTPFPHYIPFQKGSFFALEKSGPKNGVTYCEIQGWPDGRNAESIFLLTIYKAR